MSAKQLPTAIGAALVAFGVWRLTREGRAAGPFSASLSPLRQRALTILDTMVPSAYPDARFAHIVGGASWTPESQPGTTCGALPARMGIDLGDPEGITRFGVGGAKTQGLARGAWHEAAEEVPRGKRPKPGDILLMAFPPGSSEGTGYSHVNVLAHANGNDWITADAGQGPRLSPSAAYVSRHFEPGTLRILRLDDPQRSSRVFVGWIDLDEAMARVAFRRAFRGKAMKVNAERFSDAVFDPAEMRAGR